MNLKKSIITLGLITTMVLGGASMVFADTEPAGNGNGLQLYRSAATVEELLELKLQRIDQLVEEGRLTEELGEAYKETIQARMNNCTEIGENRENNERLGIGFGRMGGRGLGRGRGNGFRFGVTQEQ